MDYSIRPFREGDAPALAQLTLGAIHQIGATSYSPEQINAWAARHTGPERFVERARQGHVIFIAANTRNIPVAYALLEPDGHLDMLYCHPDHSRRALTERLLKAAEDTARARKIAVLYTEASELARAAFERAGYAVLRRRDFEIDGVAIHNYAMEKQLL